ncbi:uncharacterized protein L201_006051 [Kwoniella dendrophila CBS 6074]|uniref:Siderophore iron transporter 3 n=1 Tax=Kwoniella dendrophila CBS 6074 TaxID=1295534 RepID=A0AAX4K2R1_9TREE
MATSRFSSEQNSVDNDNHDSQRPSLTHTHTEDQLNAKKEIGHPENGGDHHVPTLSKDEQDSLHESIEQDVGVTKIEALYLVFSGWKIWILWGSIALIANVYALQGSTTSTCQEQGSKKSLTQMIVHYGELIDIIGLLLMAFAWALLLLPFTLYSSAKNHWKNPSLIAMFVVGGILMIVFTVWELRFAKHPIMPRRILNKSLICSCVIDFSYYLSGYIHSTYYLSWVYVVVDWSARDYAFFSNITTVGLCLFGVVAGLIQRYTHRYKYLQVTGLLLRIVGQAIVYVQTRHITRSDALMVMGPVIISMGGACSVVGSQVAAQGSVPHQDMALAMALLALWTRIGGAIGGAISSAIWTNQLPKHLKANLGPYLNQTQINNIYGSIKVARATKVHRELVIKSYLDTAWYLEVPTLVLCVVPLIAGLITTNFFLGENHNSIEDKKVIIHHNPNAIDEEILREKAKQVEERVRMETGKL